MAGVDERQRRQALINDSGKKSRSRYVLLKMRVRWLEPHRRRQRHQLRTYLRRNDSAIAAPRQRRHTVAMKKKSRLRLGTRTRGSNTLLLRLLAFSRVPVLSEKGTDERRVPLPSARGDSLFSHLACPWTTLAVGQPGIHPGLIRIGN